MLESLLVRVVAEIVANYPESLALAHTSCHERRRRRPERPTGRHQLGLADTCRNLGPKA